MGKRPGDTEMRKLLFVGAAALVLAGTSIAHADEITVPLPRERPACVLLDPVNCDKLQPLPNWQADNLDIRLTGYGFPWTNVHSFRPQSCGVHSVDHFGLCEIPVMASGK